MEEPAGGAWSGLSLRSMFTDIAILEPARVAQALEAILAQWDEEERLRMEAASTDADV